MREKLLQEILNKIKENYRAIKEAMEKHPEFKEMNRRLIEAIDHANSLPPLKPRDLTADKPHPLGPIGLLVDTTSGENQWASKEINSYTHKTLPITLYVHNIYFPTSESQPIISKEIFPALYSQIEPTLESNK